MKHRESCRGTMCSCSFFVTCECKCGCESNLSDTVVPAPQPRQTPAPREPKVKPLFRLVITDPQRGLCHSLPFVSAEGAKAYAKNLSRVIDRYTFEILPLVQN